VCQRSGGANAISLRTSRHLRGADRPWSRGAARPLCVFNSSMKVLIDHAAW